MYTHNIYIYTYICSLRDPSHSIATARRQRHNRKEEMKIIGQCSCSLLSGRLWVAIGRLWVALGRLWELLGGFGSSWAALGRLLASSGAALGRLLRGSWQLCVALVRIMLTHVFFMHSVATASEPPPEITVCKRPQLPLYTQFVDVVPCAITLLKHALNLQGCERSEQSCLRRHTTAAHHTAWQAQITSRYVPTMSSCEADMAGQI